MQAQEFLGRVREGAHLASMDEALTATRATLETLAERLGPDASRHLGARLPAEIQRLLANGGTPQAERFSSDEFLLRVCAREGVDLPASAAHARAVIGVLMQAVAASEIEEVLRRLPTDYRRLFVGAEGTPSKKS